MIEPSFEVLKQLLDKKLYIIKQKGDRSITLVPISFRHPPLTSEPEPVEKYYFV